MRRRGPWPRPLSSPLPAHHLPKAVQDIGPLIVSDIHDASPPQVDHYGLVHVPFLYGEFVYADDFQPCDVGVGIPAPEELLHHLLHRISRQFEMCRNGLGRRHPAQVHGVPCEAVCVRRLRLSEVYVLLAHVEAALAF